MKILFLLLAVFTTNIFAKDLSASQMKFSYKSYDGETNYDCEHKISNDLAHIWDLYCFDENNVIKKQFTATVWISKYQRQASPQNTYELIYRISDQNLSSILHTGSSHWINLDQDSGLHSLTLSQSVENDLAGIYLDVRY